MPSITNLTSEQISQQFTTGRSPVNDHRLSSAPAPYHPAMPDFSVFPGLNSIAQSLSSQSQTSLATPTQPSFSPQAPQSPSSSSNSDLERLERLKKEILEGQNPIYKAIPQPSFLESLYLGRSEQAQTSVPAHPDQISSESPNTNGSQSFALNQLENDKKAGASGDSEPGCTVTANIDAKLPSTTINQVAQALDGAVSSRHPDGFGLVGIPSAQTVDARISSDDERASHSIDSPEQDAHKPTSNEVDSAKHMHYMTSGPSAMLSNPDHSSLQYSDVRPLAPPDAFNKSFSITDPPYDPKESLRGSKGNTLLSNDSNGYGVGPYGSFDTHPGSSMDKVPMRGKERDHDQEWDKPLDYSYVKRHNVPGDFDEKRASLTLNTDSRDSRYWHPKRQDSRHALQNQLDIDGRRLTPNVSDLSSGSAVDRVQNAPSSERIVFPANKDSAMKQANVILGDQPSATPSIIPNTRPSDNPSDNHLAQNDSSSLYIRPGDGNSASNDIGRSQRNDVRGRPPSVDDGHSQTTTTDGNPVAGLEERIGSRASVALEERSGIRIPLEERISSPPVDKYTQAAPMLQERIGVRPPLENRLSSSLDIAEIRSPAAVEVSHVGYTHSIPTPLSLFRPRNTEERTSSSSPISTSANARELQQRIQDRPAVSSSSEAPEHSDNLLQPRQSVYGKDPHTPVQGHSLIAHSSMRPSLSEEPAFRDKNVETSDPRFARSLAYRDGRDVYYTEGGMGGHYERPILQERDSAPFEDRTKTSLETREWRDRERASYSRPYPSRLETTPFSDSPPRVWTANVRNSKFSPSTYNERDIHFERDFERRSNVPRSWDRNDLARPRPPPEVYPPPGAVDRELYTASEYRERRVRGRSPSPNGGRRDIYGGPPATDLRPAKRIRDEGYYDDRERRYSNHYSRPTSPPPSTAGSYYDMRPPYPPEDGYSSYGRIQPPDVTYYGRGVSDMSAHLPPSYRSKTIYSRPDLDKYSAIPPRTA